MAYRQDLALEVIKQLRGGRTQEELSEGINQLVQECRKTGKKGQITLKIDIKPDKGDSGQYFITDEIKIKEPTFERGQTLMWGTPEGNLQRTDPNQGELDLKAVPQEPVAPRFVSEPTQTPKQV